MMAAKSTVVSRLASILPAYLPILTLAQAACGGNRGFRQSATVGDNFARETGSRAAKTWSRARAGGHQRRRGPVRARRLLARPGRLHLEHQDLRGPRGDQGDARRA